MKTLQKFPNVLPVTYTKDTLTSDPLNLSDNAVSFSCCFLRWQSYCGL